MQKLFNILPYIFIIGAAQGFILSYFLFKRKENITANRLLSVTMIIFSLDLLNVVAIVSGMVKYFPWSIGLTNTLPYFYGPIIYIYVKILKDAENKFKKEYMIHFLPFILTQIYAILFFYFESPDYQLSLINPKTIAPWHIILVGNLIPIQGIIYMILTVFESLKYNSKIKQSFSNIDSINLAWVRHLVIGTVMIWSVVLISYMLNFFYGEELQGNVIIYFSISILLYTLGFKGLSQPQVNFPIGIDDKKPALYKKSGLDDTTAERLLERLLKLMDEGKLYLNTKLSLNDLAEKLDISSHNLSEIINTKLEKNFYDFINSYRISEVIRMMKDEKFDNYSLLAIGFEAGFSSKSAFYSAFKKITGETPAKYKELIITDEVSPANS